MVWASELEKSVLWHFPACDLEHRSVYLSLNFLIHKKGLTVFLTGVGGKWDTVSEAIISLAFIIVTKEGEWLLSVKCKLVLKGLHKKKFTDFRLHH